MLLLVTPDVIKSPLCLFVASFPLLLFFFPWINAVLSFCWHGNLAFLQERGSH